ncbi:pXl [Rhizobium phage 16-3]|uniref:acetyltransferase n=1 Tax=Rhizobium phage 16-3 TaxID=10704 RepID=UPI00001B2EC4|nr:acetyltransferase [Rhizobium phage 16-3]ABF71277.1 pXl [Rhizobium phage 16-3]
MNFRKATINDAKMLFDWRNDPDTRAMSRDTSELVWDNHVAWLSRRLEREDHGLYIAERGGEPVGTVRLDHDEISYTVSPSHRRQGVGEAMLSAARQEFGQKVAEVKRDNIASVKVAERAGHFVKFID